MSYDIVKKARDPKRVSPQDVIKHVFYDFFELHGDRFYSDDRAVIGGIARFEGTPVTIIAIDKGRDLEEHLLRNHGMAHPEGYRKARRLMAQAEKFGRPIITLIDTPGAYPGIGAEERGQAEAIAQNLAFMSTLSVPVISIILGEAGSGGALGIAVANRVYMCENSIYSILSPEGFASILFKDASKAKDIVGLMKITPNDLQALGVIDGIILEPDTLDGFYRNVKQQLSEDLLFYSKMKPAQVRKERHKKFREIGDVIHERM